jgi:hypothetical protein
MFLTGMTGCATTGTDTSEAQQEATLRTIGRGIGAALALAAPEALPTAQEYCVAYAEIDDAVEAEGLIRTALSYFLKDYAGSEALADAVADALVAIGFEDGAIAEIVAAEAEIDEVDIPEMTEEVISNLRLIIDGFCSMVGGISSSG